ncbi:MAG: sodium-dependent bicarbonate transport family permease [Saprospiraceae bacterium]|nr:sodium-dependent bicarbonate transport family permease [Saprospiraceae bacterium]
MENLTNPALLFFLLGIVAVQLKSDLKIPANSSKFIAIYLLLSIGFKGGQELAHSGLNAEIFWSLFFGIMLATVVPVLAFFIIKRKMSIQNAGAIAASYGSVSAVTFVTAVSFLDMEKVAFDGHMIAVMAIMEAPAIVVGVLLMRKHEKTIQSSLSTLLRHSFTNGSVLLLLGSLFIGMMASEAQAEGIKPFTTDIFKGFLAVFLLDMGITSGKQLHAIFEKGVFPFIFSSVMPFIHGTIALYLSTFITNVPGNQLLFAILAASASYIAVPAAMKSAAPKANSSIYLPMALGITFPINVIIGIPFYYYLIQSFAQA